MRSFFVAKNEIQHLLRERTFFLILTVFILISLASTYIGWASQHTVESVYQESAITLQSLGKAVPPSPFSNLPPLGIVKNMIIYVVLIGSLLAITIGHSIGTKDQKAGVVRILFSKPLTKKEFLIGKALSLGINTSCNPDGFLNNKCGLGSNIITDVRCSADAVNRVLRNFFFLYAGLRISGLGFRTDETKQCSCPSFPYNYLGHYNLCFAGNELCSLSDGFVEPCSAPDRRS